VRDAVKSALILGTVGAGGVLIVSGLTGWKIPFLEGESVEDLKDRIMDAKVVIDRIPVAYDATKESYQVWVRGTEFPAVRTEGIRVPRDDEASLSLSIEYPTLADEWEDADSIRVRIRNPESVPSSVAYVSVAVVNFANNPSLYPNYVDWVYTRPVQPVPEIPPGKEILMSLDDRVWGGSRKGEELGMKSRVESVLGIDKDNVGLSVTLYGDWTGSSIISTRRTITRSNTLMRKALDKGEATLARVFHRE